jgi:hypothetical protein
LAVPGNPDAGRMNSGSDPSKVRGMTVLYRGTVVLVILFHHGGWVSLAARLGAGIVIPAIEI